jgi:hypothetical protein
MKQPTQTPTLPKMIGHIEQIALPDLGIDALDAKIDTGAATSALHCINIELVERDGKEWIRFTVVLHHEDHDDVQECFAPYYDSRKVKNSGGIAEPRYVIATTMTMGGQSWPIELTLARRRNLKYRMIIGRQALRAAGLVVNPSRRHLSKPLNG